MKKQSRRIAILLCSITAIASGIWMYRSYQAEKLWGYIPLFFLLSLWFSISLLLLPRFSKHPHNTKRYALATLTGLLLYLGFPTMPFLPLIFVAFTPLLLVEDDIARSRPGAAKWEVFKYSYHAFVLWNILSTYWIANTAFAASIIAFLVNALFMSIPFVAFHQVKKILGARLGYVAFVAFWLSFEYLHMRHDATWSWLNLGNAFASYPSLVQWYEYTGTFGGSLWILIANVYLYKWLSPKFKNTLKWEKTSQRTTKQLSYGDYFYMLLLFVLPLLLSLWMYTTYVEKGIPREVVVVQPNFEPHYVKFNLTRQQTLEQFIKLSKAALSKESDYLVFPETSFHGIRYHRLHSDTQLRALHKLVDEYPHLSLVTGIGSSKVYAKGEQPSPTARTHIRGGDTLYWESQNAAIQIHSNSKDIDFYLKSKLVPGAEIFPYHRFLFFIKPIVDQLGGAPGGLERQATRSVFSSPSGKVAPVICYESIYGEYCTGYIRNGAEAIFIVTNDGWWDNTAGHRQHLAFARLRAIETRRAIARAANSGISAFINQRGDVISATRYDEAASLKENILFNNEITFYTLWGDMIGRIAGFLSILLLLNALVKGLMKKT